MRKSLSFQGTNINFRAVFFRGYGTRGKDMDMDTTMSIQNSTIDVELWYRMCCASAAVHSCIQWHNHRLIPRVLHGAGYKSTSNAGCACMPPGQGDCHRSGCLFCEARRETVCMLL